MPATSHCISLVCPACDDQSVYGTAQVVAELRNIGMLKRVAEPEWELVVELFSSAASQFPCSQCDHVGLLAQPVTDDDDDWPQARLCEVCKQPIPDDRLELFPDAQRCAKCQDSSDPVESNEKADFCPRCGALMVMRQASGTGITRYKMVCSECHR